MLCWGTVCDVSLVPSRWGKELCCTELKWKVKISKHCICSSVKQVPLWKSLHVRKHRSNVFSMWQRQRSALMTWAASKTCPRGGALPRDQHLSFPGTPTTLVPASSFSPRRTATIRWEGDFIPSTDAAERAKLQKAHFSFRLNLTFVLLTTGSYIKTIFISLDVLPLNWF